MTRWAVALALAVLGTGCATSAPRLVESAKIGRNNEGAWCLAVRFDDGETQVLCNPTPESAPEPSSPRPRPIEA